MAFYDLVPSADPFQSRFQILFLSCPLVTVPADTSTSQL